MTGAPRAGSGKQNTVDGKDKHRGDNTDENAMDSEPALCRCLPATNTNHNHILRVDRSSFAEYLSSSSRPSSTNPRPTPHYWQPCRTSRWRLHISAQRRTTRGSRESGIRSGHTAHRLRTCFGLSHVLQGLRLHKSIISRPSLCVDGRVQL
jgi:hypothetical protein